MKHIKSLEAVDKALLRKIFKAHCKTPKEFLYLESGAFPLWWIIAERRKSFLQHIMNRHDNELIKKVFLAQKESPTQGDFVTLVEKDLKDLGNTYEEVTSGTLTKTQLKHRMKTSTTSVTLGQLNTMLSTHTKVKKKNIKYNKLEMQSYIKVAICQVKTLLHY